MHNRDAVRSTLTWLDSEVESRVQAIRAERPDWPCRAGCSHCCRTLARPLELTAGEWDRIERALDELSPGEAAGCRRRLRDRTQGSPGSRVCPLLDEESGRCRVYDGRPLACRTYGYYVASDGLGRWCTRVESLPSLSRVTLGHEHSLTRKLGSKFCTYRSFRESLEDDCSGIL